MSKVKLLRFKREFAEKIAKGEKNCTLRLSTNLKAGDIVRLKAGEEDLGLALITEVRWKGVGSITNKEAREDGFPRKRELLKALKRIYKGRKIGKNTMIALIYFRRIQTPSE